MTYIKHAKAEFGGSLLSSVGGAEIWACTLALHTGQPAGYWLANPQSYANLVGPLLKAWFIDPANTLPSNAQLEYLKVNNIDAAGHYAEPVTHQYLVTGTVKGPTPANLPSFCSVCTTWETGNKRGPAHRGRMFLPNYTYSADGSFLQAAIPPLVVATGKKLLSVFLQNEPTGGLLVRPCVVSKIGTGALQEINGVSCDNIYDFQSRRKNRLNGLRTTVTFP